MKTLGKSLTKAEKRVLIAKDVLELLDAGKFKAKTGNGYFKTNKRISSGNINFPLEKILKTTKECEVCALGALFYAHVNRFNQIKANDLGLVKGDILYCGWDDATSNLSKYFFREQLHNIERDFEKDGSPGRIANDKLSKIMNNIIKNKGEYKQ
jgi:hypothetical protein